MRRRLIVSAVLGVLLYAAPARASSITFDSIAVDSNATFGMPVRVSDVLDLIAYSFRVTYDPSYLQLVSVAEGTALGSGGGTTLPCTVGAPGGDTFPCTTGAGNVEVGSLLLDIIGVNIGAAGDVLSLLTFQALQDGVTPVTLTLISLSDSLGNEIAGLPTSVTADVTIGVVPEPSTLLLMSAGLAGLARRLRRGRTPLPSGNCGS